MLHDVLSAGLHNLGDVQKLIELMPRPLAQYLRVSAIVRNTAANLGGSIHDRLRVNATAALKGEHCLGLPLLLGLHVPLQLLQFLPVITLDLSWCFAVS